MRYRLLLPLLSLSFITCFANSVNTYEEANVSESRPITVTHNGEKPSAFSLEVAISTEQPLLFILLLAFFAGLLVSFTPCVYPMIPITVGILQAQATKSLWRNFFLSCSYVLGIATIYALLGYVVATTSLIFGQWFASPWFISLAVFFFVYIAFAMFGFYNIYIPAFLQHRGTVDVRGSFLYSFIFGLLSGTVASPCLTPALALVLGYVSKLANPIAGFLILFFFSLGMGVLLIFVGTFSGLLGLLPQAGSWMLEVKKFFGFLMLGVGVYLLQPLLDSWVTLALYATLMLAAAMYYLLTSRCRCRSC